MPDDSEKWTALSISHIERTPKRIIQAIDFYVAFELTESQENDLVKIRGLIKNGGDLTPYYRASTRCDNLLKEKQVLHLHLGGSGSNALLYLIQYPERVLFLCVDDHIHLEDNPAGKKLSNTARQRAESEIEAEVEQDHENKATIGASISALKASIKKRESEQSEAANGPDDA